jgi:hypothetical protein
VLGAPLDQDQRTRHQLVFSTIDDSRPSARDHVEPLIGAPVTILRSPFCLTRSERHLRGLGAIIAHDHAEPFPKSEVFWTVSICHSTSPLFKGVPSNPHADWQLAESLEMIR